MDPSRNGHSRSRPAWAHRVLQAAEGARFLDRPAGRLAGALRGAADGPLGQALRGRPLGHPLHPIAVTVPIGAWVCSAVFDLLPDGRDAARRLVATGLLAAPAAVVLGLADYTGLDVRQRRVALVHAAGNAVATTLFAASYAARGRGGGRLLGALGLAAVGIGGALGGHLAYAQGAGVFRWQPLDDLAPAEVAGDRPARPRNPA
jgi:hypothetical protein